MQDARFWRSEDGSGGAQVFVSPEFLFMVAQETPGNPKAVVSPRASAEAMIRWLARLRWTDRTHLDGLAVTVSWDAQIPYAEVKATWTGGRNFEELPAAPSFSVAGRR